MCSSVINATVDMDADAGALIDEGGDEGEDDAVDGVVAVDAHAELEGADEGRAEESAMAVDIQLDFLAGSGAPPVVPPDCYEQSRRCCPYHLRCVVALWLVMGQLSPLGKMTLHACHPRCGHLPSFAVQTFLLF